MIGSPLFISDLDGTLLDSSARLSAVSADLLNEAISRGAKFTVATARTAATVEPLLREVHMNLPAIVMTGAALWHFDEKKYSDCRFIRPERAHLIKDLFVEAGVSPFVYTLPSEGAHRILEVFYKNPAPSAADNKFIEERIGLPLKKFHLQVETPDHLLSNTLLFFASGETTLLHKLAEKVSAVTPCSVSCYDDIYNPGVGLIEIFAEGVSKAAAVENLKKSLAEDNVVVFGDNLNDIPMFNVASLSIAVANASPTVRDAAGMTIGDNDSDTVARYIVESSLQKQF